MPEVKITEFGVADADGNKRTVVDRITGISPPVPWVNEIRARDQHQEWYSKEIGPGGFLMSIEFSRAGTNTTEQEYFTALSFFLGKLNRVGNFLKLPLSSYDDLTSLIPTTTNPPTISSVSDGVTTLDRNAPLEGAFVTQGDKLIQIDSVVSARRVVLFPDYGLTSGSLAAVTNIHLEFKNLVSYDQERVVTKSFSDVEYRSIVEFKVIGAS